LRSFASPFAGLKWRHSGSDGFQVEETPLTRIGNAYLRYYFCEAVLSVQRRDPEYAAFYQKKYAEARKHRHKCAMVLTARKLVRLVVHLLATNQPFQPRKV
jgi:transposase